MTSDTDPTRRALLGLVGAVPLVGATVRLDDYLDEGRRTAAAGDSPVDCTDAFARALGSGRRVSVPPGRYGLAGLALPTGSGIVGGGGVVLHQLRPDRPAIDVVSDVTSGQLADLVIDGVSLVGHPHATAPLVRLAAAGDYAIWRSRFVFFAKNSCRALDVGDPGASNVFECTFEVVSEGTRDIAVRTAGGVYNRYHLFLTQTATWALDDRSDASEIRVVAENSVIVRGQANQVTARVEGIAAPRAAGIAAVIDQGFGNTFTSAEVNMPKGDSGKLVYAFSAFQGSIFINPQVIGPGAPPHPFAPTAGYPFTVIGGRSGATHPIEAIFDGSAKDRDPRSITFVGDVADFTPRPTRPGTLTIQHVTPADGAMVAIAPATQLLIVDASRDLVRIHLVPVAAATTPDGWMLSVSTAKAIGALEWPATPRFVRLPRHLAAGGRLDVVYQAKDDTWFVR